MSPSTKKQLARVRRESTEHLQNSAVLEVSVFEHMRQSKEAIARSLQLLKDTAVRS